MRKNDSYDWKHTERERERERETAVTRCNAILAYITEYTLIQTLTDQKSKCSNSSLYLISINLLHWK